MLFLVSKHYIKAIKTHPNTPKTLHPISCMLKYEEDFRDPDLAKLMAPNLSGKNIKGKETVLWMNGSLIDKKNI